jgi:hypothetical protein
VRQAHESLKAACSAGEAARTEAEQKLAAEQHRAARQAADLEAAELLQGRMLADLEQLQHDKKKADVRVTELEAAVAAAQARPET